MTPRTALAAAILVCITRAAFAEPSVEPAEPAVDDEVAALPCRPTIACTAEIVRGGTLEVETGFAHRRAADANASGVLALVKYSITDRLQLQLGTNNLVMASGDTTAWLDGVYLGPKVVLARQTEQLPTLAVSALFSIPTRSGDDAMTRTRDGYFWVYASKDLLGFHADGNLGLDVLSLTDAPAVQGVAALSVSHDLAFGLGAMVETYAFEGGGSYAQHDAGVLMALSYAPTPRIMFDLGGDVALHRDARRATLFAGVTFIPYRAARPHHPVSPELTAARHQEP